MSPANKFTAWASSSHPNLSILFPLDTHASVFRTLQCGQNFSNTQKQNFRVATEMSDLIKRVPLRGAERFLFFFKLFSAGTKQMKHLTLETWRFDSSSCIFHGLCLRNTLNCPFRLKIKSRNFLATLRQVKQNLISVCTSFIYL